MRAARVDAQSVDSQTIDAYVTSQMQSMHIPGVALGIVHGEKIVHLQGFGVANPAGQLMTPHTPLILGSTSKSFTALAIMQLVEARSNCIFNGFVGIARQGSADNLACGDTARVVEQMADS